MHYLTRHLEALRDLPVGNALVSAGGRFYATEVDADYLISSKRAQEVARPPSAGQTPAPAQQFTAPPALAAAVTVEVALPVAEPAADPAPDQTDPALLMPELRRRGRPTNAEKLARQAAEGGDSTQAVSES